MKSNETPMVVGFFWRGNHFFGGGGFMVLIGLSQYYRYFQLINNSNLWH